ncbi:HTH-type transcriptional regulator [Legionella lansingensis]|uniref:HTH-type transcriptional regulator n=1 Tax=Legionella lansingensis TaxID=45067 RepID=A0A0W0VQS8_9GAMM|nr:helix-turn-helix domain-containing protein [Legionella lansingensis]KTD22285.1 HTH-type transcriptional regulator [Legionella lansingensis]SNV50646.1 HTH-type transcriptional regulator [Legionella lansingensis]
MSEPTTTISDNLRHLLKLHDELSVSELARLTEIPQPTLHHLLSGTTKKPRRSVLEKLANFFSVSISQLTGTLPLSQIIPNTIKESLKITTIPVLTWGMLSDWPKEHNRNDLKEIILDRQVGQHSFALIMRDSSMEPLFPEKAILIFDSSKMPKDREFAVVHLLKDNSIIFNRVFIDQSEFYIKKEQPDGNIQLLKIQPSEDKFVGTLIEVRLQF